MSKAQKIARLRTAGERILRMDLHKIYTAHAEELPVATVRDNNGVPAVLIQKWENDFINWYHRRRKFWQEVWERSIELIEYKFETQEEYDNWIEARSLTIGVELANVTADAVSQTLFVYSDTSWTRLQRELRQSIGLQTTQVNSFAKQSQIIRDNYPPARAGVLVDRLYRKKINYRAQLIARTEMSDGINHAQISDIRSRMNRGDLPDMEKRWSTIGDDRTSDGCLTNEGDGWIDVEGTFNSGHECPPRFPGCRCGIQYRAKRARLAA